MSEQILLDRGQCPECFGNLELVGLMDEAVWDSMTVQERVNLFTMAGLAGKHGSKSYDDLGRLGDEQLLAVCDYQCPMCGTDWPVGELLRATCTPHQLEIYIRQHRYEKD